jgi:hypothetical protein
LKGKFVNLGGGGEVKALLVFERWLMRWEKPNVLLRAAGFSFVGLCTTSLNMASCNFEVVLFHSLF